MPIKREKRATMADTGKVSAVPSAEGPEKASSPSFITEFMQLCDEEGVSKVPKIGHLLELSSSFTNVEKPSLYSVAVSKSTEQAEAPPTPTTVFVAYEYPDRPDSLRQLVFKGLSLEIGMLAALKRCAPSFTTLSNLRLENCSMTSDMLQDLADLLVNNKNIYDLSLDMNPIPEQNYYVLFQQDIRLQFLSLRLCSINDDGLEPLSKELGFKESGQTLIYLNLNHNHLTCEGARHLANALRTNRTLAVLLLAGNYIGDEGAIALADVFQQFPLTHEEVVMRRRRNLRRLIQRNLQAESTCGTNLDKKNRQSKMANLTVKDGTAKSASVKKKDKEPKTAAGRDKKKGKEPKGGTIPNLTASATLSVLSEYQVSRRLSKSGVTADQRRLEQVAEQEIEPDPHPYMNDIKQFDGEVWCPGNMKLAHLNLSHNRIGSQGVIQLLKAVQYQEDTFQPNKGLITILIQGNPITECPELHGLLELLAIRYTRMENTSSPNNPASAAGYNTSPVNTNKQGAK